MLRKNFNIVLLVLAIVLITVSPAAAQAPGTISYQGRLAADDGEPITTEVSVTFAVYAAASGGTTLSLQILTFTPDANGIFTVQLGPFGATVFDGSLRYLGIKVGADAEMTPRQVLTAAPYSFNTNKIADNAITTAKIASGAVTNSDLANNAVTGTKILDGAVSEADIANSAVTSNKIATNAVSTTKIADGGVGNADLAGNSVTGNKVVDGTLTNVDLANNAVTGAKVSNGSLYGADIADEPGLAFKEALPANSFNPLPPPGATTIDSISITVPAAGYIYVWANTTICVDHITGTTDEIYFQVSAVRDNINYSAYGFVQVSVPREAPTQASRYYMFPTDAHRPFYVASAGTYKFFANCNVSAGAGDNDSYFDLQITAFYFPTAYGSVNLPAASENLQTPDDASGNIEDSGHPQGLE